MIKTPSTSEDAGIEKCTVSIDKSLKGVADIFEDQPELITEDTEKGIHDCKAAIEMHEAYVGKEDEPVDLEERNSNKLKSLQAATYGKKVKYSKLLFSFILFVSWELFQWDFLLLFCLQSVAQTKGMVVFQFLYTVL